MPCHSNCKDNTCDQLNGKCLGKIYEIMIHCACVNTILILLALENMYEHAKREKNEKKVFS